MAAPRKILTNIASIGTEDNPLDAIYVRRINKCENISHVLPVYTEGPEAETLSGIQITPVTNTITNINNTIYTGTVQINNTLGVTGTATMATITASGVITANGTISMGSNIKLNAYWLSRDGGNEGIQVEADGDVICSKDLSVTNDLIVTEDISLGRRLNIPDYDVGIQVPTSGIYLWWDSVASKLKVNIDGGTYETIQFEP
jgi:hypothetical protein